MTQAQQRTYMCNYINHMGSQTLQQLKKLSFDEVKELFKTTKKRVNTFTPMKSDDTVPKVVAGSSKIDAEQELNQESSKRQKIGEGSKPAKESKGELSQEQLQKLMIIVLEEGMNVEALQTKYPIIDWEVYTEDSRNDAEKKDDDCVCKESGIVDQERPENSTQGVNTDGSSINIEPYMFSLGDIATLKSIHADFCVDKTEVYISNITTTYPVPSTPNTRIHKDHSLDHVIGDVQSVEPKKVTQALTDPSWIEAIQDELLQFKLQKGYTQEEGIDYDEVFALVARIEAIKLFLAYASFMNFVVYQMNVKRFEDPEFPDRVYKVEKALYGLHQAPKAWYETLSTYLLENGFQRGTIDKTLFIKKVKGDILLVQIYVDDIIFGSTNKELCTEFEKLMHKKFQMSYMGEFTFFLGLQFSTVRIASTPMETSKPLLKDAEDKDVDVHLYRSMIGSLIYLTDFRPDIMFVVCVCARFQVTPKVSHLHAVKRIFRYLKGQPKLGLWYPKDSPFDLEAYTDSDYAGASLDRKSTTGAEYVAAANCCGQVLWIQNQMLDYGYNFMNTKIFIDNESTICIVKNPVFHSKTKHIEIRHHFIRDSYEKILIQVIKIHTDHNVAYLLTKALDFWETATAKTLDNGEIKLTATIDGKVKIVTEASVRRHLQLADSDGISSLPTTEIFEQLSLMGSPTQSPIADEAAFIGVDVRYGGATTTITSLEAGHDSGNIDMTPTMPHDSPLLRVNTLGSDEGSMTLQELMVFCTTLSKKVESLETDLKQTKLTYGAAYTKLIKKVKKLENKVKSSQARRRARIIVSDDEDDLEDPSKQGRKIAEIDQDPAILLVQHDAKIQGRHVRNLVFSEIFYKAEHVELDFDLDTAKDVSTAKPVSTAGATVTTASAAAVSTQAKSITRRVSTMIHLLWLRQWCILGRVQPKIKTTKLELKEEERQRIAMVHEASSSFNVEEWENIQARVKADEELAQRLQANEREMYTEVEQARMLTLFETTMRRVNTFVPIESEVDRAVPELAAGSSKRDAEEELDQESSKRQKTGKSSELAEEPRDIEVELKILFEPNTDDELWKLQKHSHDLTWRLYDSCGVHHVSTEKGIDIYILVEKEYPLSRGTLTLMLVAKLLVEQDNEMSRELLRKIFMQAKRPRK
ncbi:putative ribonuclease H-like domain-containing protein [Tanacetum coccineum]